MADRLTARVIRGAQTAIISSQTGLLASFVEALEDIMRKRGLGATGQMNHQSGRDNFLKPSSLFWGDLHKFWGWECFSTSHMRLSILLWFGGEHRAGA